MSVKDHSGHQYHDIDPLALEAARPAERFRYWEQTLTEIDHPYNTSILNERAVELAIAARWLATMPADQLAAGLEVGNVMGHYFGASRWRVVDLYEESPGVENVDLFDVGGSYPWVLSISTVEHVGWDVPEDERDPTAAGAAVRHLERLLVPGGQLLVTVPLGHNPPLDEAILDGDFACHHLRRQCTLVRDGRYWVQTAEPEFRPYGAADFWAGAVWVAEFVAPLPLQ